MRSKTDKEKEFNEIAASHSIKAFTAQDFDDNTELKKAFISFVECTDFNTLKDSSSEGEKLDMYYLKFLESYRSDPNNYDMSNTVVCTTSLFELHSPIKEISCFEYFDAFCLLENMPPFQDEIDELIIINDKIKNWHKFRREVNKIKPFVEARFPRWAKVSKEEKKSYIESIKKEICDLEILRVDTVKLKSVIHFLENYTGLNQLNKYKVDFLLDLELPHVNSRTIAKKIIDNSKY